MNKSKRLFRIVDLLSQAPASSPQELALKLKVSERSIYRYLHELQALGFDIRQIKDSTQQKIIRQIMTPITFSAAEALALVAACQSLCRQDGLPYTEQLQSAMQKVEGALATLEDKRTFYRMQTHFKYMGETLHDFSPWKGMLAIINNCIRRNNSLKVTYDSYSGSEVSDRVMDPYVLFFQNGNLYLVAYCHKRKKIRTFRIDRIRKLKALTNTFVRDPGFNFDEYLGSSWRVWRGTKEVTIKFIVYPPASRLFRESNYHESQQIEELENDKICCSITTYYTPEMKSWLLSWGKRIRVLEPINIVKAIKDELLKNIASYD